MLSRIAEVSTALLKSVVTNFVQQKVPPAEQKAPRPSGYVRGEGS